MRAAAVLAIEIAIEVAAAVAFVRADVGADLFAQEMHTLSPLYSCVFACRTLAPLHGCVRMLACAYARSLSACASANAPECAQVFIQRRQVTVPPISTRAK